MTGNGERRRARVSPYSSEERLGCERIEARPSQFFDFLVQKDLHDENEQALRGDENGEYPLKSCGRVAKDCKPTYPGQAEKNGESRRRSEPLSCFSVLAFERCRLGYPALSETAPDEEEDDEVHCYDGSKRCDQRQVE